jgi:hypothetical protein
MFHYAAVECENTTGIYKCEKDEDVEAWINEKEDIFPAFEGTVAFETNEELKMGQYVCAVSLEIMGMQYKSLDFETKYFIYIQESEEWITKKIREFTKVEDFKFKHKDHRAGSEEVEVGRGYAFIVYLITGWVKPDPRRKNSWQVKFEKNGLSYTIDVNPMRSGFIELYDRYIAPWLIYNFGAKSENAEMNPKVLHLLTKILIKSKAKKFSDPDFFRENEREICDGLKVIFT